MATKHERKDVYTFDDNQVTIHQFINPLSTDFDVFWNGDYLLTVSRSNMSDDEFNAFLERVESFVGSNEEFILKLFATTGNVESFKL